MTTPAAEIVDTAAYTQAVEEAVGAAAAYYAGGTSPLDDDAYDRLVRSIAAYEAGHPEPARQGRTTRHPARHARRVRRPRRHPPELNRRRGALTDVVRAAHRCRASGG
ncbi:hypothetical protein ACWDGI_39490 [Streptomyces sp. NPDC001220]